MLAISTTMGVLLALGGFGLLVLAVAGVLWSRRRPSDVPDIPPAMQPGPSDADLEKPNLEKLQGWGVALTLFFVLWFPLVWLFEPNVNLDDEKELIEISIERGEQAVKLFSEENPGGVGCVQCHGPDLNGGQILFQGKPYPVPPLRTVCGKLTIEQIRDTIMQGRPGTPMPSWSIKFAGSLNDQQIQELVNYIVHLNLENVPEEDNKCLDPNAGVTPTATTSPAPPGAGAPEPSPPETGGGA